MLLRTLKKLNYSFRVWKINSKAQTYQFLRGQIMDQLNFISYGVTEIYERRFELKH
jgi:hypothetical protein